MGSSTCVDDYSSGTFPQVTQNAVLFVIATGVLLIIRAYPYYLEYFDKPPSNPSPIQKPSYGLGAISTIKYLCGIGLVLSGPQAFLYFIFRWAPGERSLEFACLAQDSFISFIVPFVVAYVACMMIITNMLRLKTRHKWAAVAKRYLLPIEGNEADTSPHRILFLPILRGMWCPPIIQAFQENIKDSGSQRSLQCLAMDSFGSQYCTDTSEWFELNMKLEQVDKFVTTIWTDFKKFPISDASVDCVCMPTGLFLPYISDNNVPEEEITKRKKIIFSEIYRVLKPGGVLLASNVSMLVGGWETLIGELGWVGIERLPDNLWWTYLPAKMTVAFKPKYENGDTAIAGSSSVVDEAFVITKETPSPHMNRVQSDNMWFPPGKHWRLVEILCVSTLVAWVLLIILVWEFMDELQTPSTVPYGMQFAALFVSNLISLPIVFFTMFSDLRNVARGFEINRNNQSAGTNKVSAVESVNDHGENNQQVESLRTQRIFRVYKKQLTYLAYLIGILTWLSWLPYFILDLILYEVTSLSLNKIQFINNMVAIGIFFTLIPIGQFISNRLKQQNRKLAVEDAIDDKLLVEYQTNSHEDKSSFGVSPLHVGDSFA